MPSKHRRVGIAALAFVIVIPAGAAQARVQFATVALSFEENHGQAPPAIDFVSRGSGYALFLRPGEVVLKTERATESTSAGNLEMTLIGASSRAKAVGLARQSGVASYFIGNDPSKWRTAIPMYGKVSYAGVYPGVDLVFYGNQRQMEYDFVVAPGADPSRIVWRIHGARASLDADGNLIFTGPGDAVSFNKPLIYQMDRDKRIPVEGSFAVSGNKVSFRLGRYNHSKPLVIDPVLSYATYLAGTSADSIGNGSGPGAFDNISQGLAIDSAGSIYVTGYTSSIDFPTANAFNSKFPSTNTNSPSTFITKFSPDGTSLVYSTYLGGSGGDQAYAIAVDATDNVYVTGLARSPDFPITNGAWQKICDPNPRNPTASGCPGAGSSVFVTKLNPEGTGLVYSTFLGGYGAAWAIAITVDPAGRAYVAGDEYESCSSTISSASFGCFPTTSGAVIAGNAPSADAANYAFVAVFDPTGSQLLYSTLFGDLNVTCPAGCGLTRASGIAVDSTGAFYLVGYTQAAKLPTTPGVIQPTGVPLDPTGVYVTAYRGFIAKFNPVTSGASLAYGTYLGGKTGNLSDFLTGIAIDNSNDIYVAGYADSADFPVTAGAFQTACGQGGSCHADHITKINPTGTAILWSTYLGNSRADGSDDMESSGPIQLDGKGNVYIIGQASGNFPLVNAVESMAPTSTGLVVAELDPTGSKLLFSSPVGSGGLDPEYPGGLAVDQTGDIYLAGNNLGSDLITTPGVFQPTLPGEHCCYHGYVAKIGPGGPSVALSTAGQVEPFAAQSIVAAYGTNMATGTASATSLPLPTSLDSNTVTITDSAGVARQAPLFYVSPSQINFEIPAGSAIGTATVTIGNQSGTAQSSTIQIANVSPGIYELNSAGLVAAWAVSMANGAAQLLPVYQVSGGSVVPVPLTVGPNVQVTLEIFGTGIRNATTVTATVGGLSVPVPYVGATVDAGLDQVNVGPLPQTLAGQGNVEIILTADGQTANTVMLTVQ